MHLGRFQYQKKIFYGKLENNEINAIKGNIFKKYELINDRYSLQDVKILTPTNPNKIILVGLNYKDHTSEMNFSIPEEPIIFFKPNSSIIAHQENIIYPEISKQVEFEAELAFVIKEKCYKIKREEAQKYILGYTCLNDVTARDLQKKDGQWSRAKSFDTFCPFGPFIFIPEKDFDPQKLTIKAYLNGNIKQDSNTNNLIFPIDYLLWFISQVMSLDPGDVISTGTPGGVGPMEVGDEIIVEIEKIGALINRVMK